MKIRILLATALLLSVGAGAFALSPEHNEFGQGPAQFLMTKEEMTQWKAIKSDDEAQSFIDLFWARRDPTPGTPANEFRMQFDAAVAFADKNLGNGKRARGAMTDRGRTLILYGQPKKVERSAPKQATSGPMNDTITEDNDQWVAWTYEGAIARDMFNMQTVTIRFIDRNATNDYKFDRGGADLASAQQRAIAKSITQPNLTSAPSAAPAAAAMTPAPAAAPPAAAPVATPAAAQTELATESLAKAVEELKAAKSNPYPKQVFATWGEFVTPKGEDYVPVSLYVPKSAGIDATSAVSFFGVVQDESGKNVAAFEEPAKVLSASKEDFYVDKTLMIPGGKNRGYFGLAANGKPVAMVSTDMTTAGTLDKDASAVSPLILSNNIYPLTEAQSPTDPFAFGGVKVIPKADKVFHKADELWYFFELRNPGVSEPAADAAAPVPVTGTAAPAATPKIQVKLDVEGVDAAGKKHKMAAPPREVDAIEMKGVPGHYGVGSAIPLQTFAAGDYTFTVKVIDTVKKASYTISDKFKIVD
jgi:GWxTD domain-containing protein